MYSTDSIAIIVHGIYRNIESIEFYNNSYGIFYIIAIEIYFQQGSPVDFGSRRDPFTQRDGSTESTESWQAAGQGRSETLHEIYVRYV